MVSRQEESKPTTQTDYFTAPDNPDGPIDFGPLYSAGVAAGQDAGRAKYEALIRRRNVARHVPSAPVHMTGAEAMAWYEGHTAGQEAERAKAVSFDQPVVERLRELSKLQPNWDSYGARPVKAKAIKKAERFLGVITSTPFIVPTPMGGVQVEWHTSGLTVEIEVGPRGKVTMFCKEEKP